jgi:cysteine desulfurase
MFEKLKDPKINKDTYFFDAQSTTPTDPEVLDIMNLVSSQYFANPHSSHSLGRASDDLIKESTSLIKDNLKTNDFHHIYTSGATEANNFVIKGLKDYLLKNQLKALTFKTEHKCVLNSFDYLERAGVEVNYIDVEKDGIVNIKKLEPLLDNVGFISLMMVNNEIGTIQPLQELTNLTKPKGIFVHSDIAQAMGRLSLNIENLGLDAVSISGHKFYGPKGIGMAIISEDIKKKLKPLLLGGGQQDNLRSGTLPTPLCVGFASAVNLFQEKNFIEEQYLKHLKFSELLISELKKHNISFSVNGHLASNNILETKRISSNLNLTFDGLEAITLMNNMPEFFISTGSACSAGEFDYSHVLKSLDLSYEKLKNSVRISFDKNTLEKDVIKLSDKLLTIHKNLKL